jgi:hypothetical protein
VWIKRNKIPANAIRSYVDAEVAVARIAKEVAREGLPKLVWAEIVASDVMDRKNLDC